MSFESFKLDDRVARGLLAAGYEKATPVQAVAIPAILAGHDVIGTAPTGTGKTAAFAIPILQNLYLQKQIEKSPRIIKALVLAPTRELALQIHDNFKEYGRNLDLRTAVIYGGVNQARQVAQLNQGVDILIATPGRLLDLIQQKKLTLANISYFVLDEADRMLDMGFIKDVHKIIAMIPTKRQTMLFSATMPNAILNLANEILNQPKRVQVASESATIDKIEQAVYFVDVKKKTDFLIKLLKNPEMKSVLVFSRTKHGANKIVKNLLLAGIQALAIHGNKSQGARQEALFQFKAKKLRVLVATDIAARGIDIDELSHVINYDLPEVPETYIHRMGRTGRAGLGGDAISFCSHDEVKFLQDIERHIKMVIPVKTDPIYSANYGNSSIQTKANASLKNSESTSYQKKITYPGKKKNYKKPEPKFYSKYDNKNKNLNK